MRNQHTKQAVTIGIVLGVIIACGAVFIMLNLFTTKDFSYEFCCAAIGMIATALVTYFLLQGQSASEEEKEKNTKVFEKKLAIFSAFLQKLNDVVRDGAITEEEAIDLQFQVSYLDTHINSSKRIKEISEHVKNIIEGVNDNWEQTDLLTELFEINSSFRAELYSVKEGNDHDNYRDEAVFNFKSIGVPPKSREAYARCLKILNAIRNMETVSKENVLDGFITRIWKYDRVLFDVARDYNRGKFSENSLYCEILFQDEEVWVGIWYRKDDSADFVESEIFKNAGLTFQKDNNEDYWFVFDKKSSDANIVNFVYGKVLPAMLKFRESLD